MIMPIYLYGTRVWEGPVRTIQSLDERLVGLIRDMFETMHNDEGVGLSATQVGLRISLAVIDTSEMEGHEDEKPLVVINPNILSYSEELVSMEEGCLSIPEIRAEVTRPGSVIVRYEDGNFQTVEAEYTGILARVFQHEYDHLHGRFFVDRLSSVKRHILKPKLSKIKRADIIARYSSVSAFDEKMTKRSKAFDYDLHEQLR